MSADYAAGTARPDRLLSPHAHRVGTKITWQCVAGSLPTVQTDMARSSAPQGRLCHPDEIRRPTSSDFPSYSFIIPLRCLPTLALPIHSRWQSRRPPNQRFMPSDLPSCSINTRPEHHMHAFTEKSREILGRGQLFSHNTPCRSCGQRRRRARSWWQPVGLLSDCLYDKTGTKQAGRRIHEAGALRGYGLPNPSGAAIISSNNRTRRHLKVAHGQERST